jgi:hypothetical protein
LSLLNDISIDDLQTALDCTTKEYVDNAIGAIEIPEVDLTNYALKSDIPDVSAYQTAEQVSTAINEALGVIENGTY